MKRSQAISLSPSIVDFGVVEGGVQSASQTITITNFGSATLENFTSYLSVNAYGFSVGNSTCGSSLDAGASCTVQLSIKPPTHGDPNLLSDRMYGRLIAAGDSGTAGISAWAYIAPSVPSSPVASVSSTSLTFASTAVGTSAAPQTITLTNTGSATLTISPIGNGNISGAGSNSFAATSNCGASSGY